MLYLQDVQLDRLQGKPTYVLVDLAALPRLLQVGLALLRPGVNRSGPDGTKEMMQPCLIYLHAIFLVATQCKDCVLRERP